MTGKLIFLTSSVAPRTIKCSGSADERKNEYIKAIHFYLNNTNSNVLIVDNSGYDFSKDIKNNRFESLSYIGEEKDEIFGRDIVKHSRFYIIITVFCKNARSQYQM